MTPKYLHFIRFLWVCWNIKVKLERGLNQNSLRRISSMVPLSLVSKEIAEEKKWYQTQYNMAHFRRNIASSFSDYSVFTKHNRFYASSEEKRTWLPLSSGQIFIGLFWTIQKFWLLQGEKLKEIRINIFDSTEKKKLAFTTLKNTKPPSTGNVRAKWQSGLYKLGKATWK